MVKKDNIIISEGRRALWQTIIAALFYTVTIALILLMILFLYIDFSLPMAINCIGVFSIAAFTFTIALRFSLINNVYFDFVNKLYKKEYAIGIIKIGKWEHLPNIEYVCVFKQGWSKDRNGDGMSDTGGYRYDVNVWHSTSRHFTII